MGRFINADNYPSTGQNLLGNNMFAYCGNNPVSRNDSSGTAWDTIFDALSLATSVTEVVANPYDPWAWVGLSGDLVDVLLPFVGGLGETVRAFKAADAILDSDLTEAVAKLATTGSSTRKGRIGEMLVDIISDSGKTHILVDGHTRIPDYMDSDILREIKNVNYISNMQQLKDFAIFAENTGRILELYVRPTTKVAQTVIDAGWNIKHLW